MALFVGSNDGRYVLFVRIGSIALSGTLVSIFTDNICKFFLMRTACDTYSVIIGAC